MSQEKPAAISESEFISNSLSRIAPPRRLQVAIDGPAGAGKSTVAKRVADTLGYLYIDTGAMYRAVTWLSQTRRLAITDRAGIAKIAAAAEIRMEPPTVAGENVRVFADGHEITKDIRTQEITRLVSAVSAYPAVREYLVERQRKLAEPGGVVLDGRDIGTVVLPNADLKIFLTASAEVRAKRRFAELTAAGDRPDYDALLKDIVDRDYKDSNRAIAPLQMAQDAVLILTDNMSIDEVVSHIVQLCLE